MQAQGVLRIEVEGDHAPAARGQHGSEIGGESGFPDPAFGGHHRDDFHERRGPLTSHELEGAGTAARVVSPDAANVCPGVPRSRSKTDCNGADSAAGAAVCGDAGAATGSGANSLPRIDAGRARGSGRCGRCAAAECGEAGAGVGDWCGAHVGAHGAGLLTRGLALRQLAQPCRCAALSASASSAPKREAPCGAADGAATTTGGMSRRCERVNSGAFARVTEAASLGVVSCGSAASRDASFANTRERGLAALTDRRNRRLRQVQRHQQRPTGARRARFVFAADFLVRVGVAAKMIE